MRSKMFQSTYAVNSGIVVQNVKHNKRGTGGERGREREPGTYQYL